MLFWLGVAAGRVILTHQEWQDRVKRWLVTRPFQTKYMITKKMTEGWKTSAGSCQVSRLYSNKETVARKSKENYCRENDFCR